ncbi:hypothetical protein GCM10027048_14980 [Hymenobacter coalescens]
MRRRLTVLLLLLNYLLVVASGCVGREDHWEQYRPKRAYVHSLTCQRDYALRLDCFDRCNGDQQHWSPRLPGEDIWHHLTAQINGTDAHLLAETALLPPRPALLPARPAFPRWTPALAQGLLAEPDAPPRRG